MRLQERAKMRAADARARWTGAKADRMDRDRELLRSENRLMKERMERSDGELTMALEALDDLAKHDGARPRRHWIRGILVLGAAAGSAYVMGAKAGRDRYDVLRRWWRGLSTAGDAGSGAGPHPATGVTAYVPGADPMSRAASNE